MAYVFVLQIEPGKVFEVIVHHGGAFEIDWDLGQQEYVGGEQHIFEGDAYTFTSHNLYEWLARKGYIIRTRCGFANINIYCKTDFEFDEKFQRLGTIYEVEMIFVREAIKWNELGYKLHVYIEHPVDVPVIIEHPVDVPKIIENVSV